MKLWLLERRDAGNYDESFGFVIRAATAQGARKFASQRPGDEGAG